MGCVFCATGQMGFFRQLTSTEIFEQAQRFSAELRLNNACRLSNVVMTGMGEPLANYDNVLVAIRRMNTELGIGARHTPSAQWGSRLVFANWPTRFCRWAWP